MARMTGPDSAVMCNSINTHRHTHTVYRAPSTRTLGRSGLQDLQNMYRMIVKIARIRSRGPHQRIRWKVLCEGRFYAGARDRLALAGLVGGMYDGNDCRQETTCLHSISCTKTGWSSLTHSALPDTGSIPSREESPVYR